MDVIVLIGRILYAAVFLGSGVGHLTQTKETVAYAESVGVSRANTLVPLTGVQMLVGGAMIVLGIWMDLGFLIVAAFLIPTSFIMHAFWKSSDPQERQVQQAHFMKNISMTGAAIALFALVSFVGDDLGLTFTGPLFDLS